MNEDERQTGGLGENEPRKQAAKQSSAGRNPTA